MDHPQGTPEQTSTAEHPIPSLLPSCPSTPPCLPTQSYTSPKNVIAPLPSHLTFISHASPQAISATESNISDSAADTSADIMNHDDTQNLSSTTLTNGMNDVDDNVFSGSFLANNDISDLEAKLSNILCTEFEVKLLEMRGEIDSDMEQLKDSIQGVACDLRQESKHAFETNEAQINSLRDETTLHIDESRDIVRSNLEGRVDELENNLLQKVKRLENTVNITFDAFQQEIDLKLEVMKSEIFSEISTIVGKVNCIFDRLDSETKPPCVPSAPPLPDASIAGSTSSGDNTGANIPPTQATIPSNTPPNDTSHIQASDGARRKDLTSVAQPKFTKKVILIGDSNFYPKGPGGAERFNLEKFDGNLRITCRQRCSNVRAIHSAVNSLVANGINCEHNSKIVLAVGANNIDQVGTKTKFESAYSIDKFIKEYQSAVCYVQSVFKQSEVFILAIPPCLDDDINTLIIQANDRLESEISQCSFIACPQLWEGQTEVIDRRDQTGKHLNPVGIKIYAAAVRRSVLLPILNNGQRNRYNLPPGAGSKMKNRQPRQQIPLKIRYPRHNRRLDDSMESTPRNVVRRNIHNSPAPPKRGNFVQSSRNFGIGSPIGHYNDPSCAPITASRLVPYSQPPPLRQPILNQPQFMSDQLSQPPLRQPPRPMSDYPILYPPPQMQLGGYYGHSPGFENNHTLRYALHTAPFMQPVANPITSSNYGLSLERPSLLHTVVLTVVGWLACPCWTVLPCH